MCASNVPSVVLNLVVVLLLASSVPLVSSTLNQVRHCAKIALPVNTQPLMDQWIAFSVPLAKFNQIMVKACVLNVNSVNSKPSMVNWHVMSVDKVHSPT
jgi:hypothetical protein